MHKNIVVGMHIGHDRSVSIIADGRLIGFIAEERLDRVKHSSSVKFPLNSLIALLKELNIDINTIKYYAVTYSFVNIANVINSLQDELRNILSNNNIEVFGVSHHLSHAYSSFYTSGFKEATVVVADGAGDITDGCSLESETVYLASSNGIVEVYKRTQHIPSSYSERKSFFNYEYIPDCDRKKQISLARKYEQLTYFLDFKWGQAGKTMGLAPYGKNFIKTNKKYNSGLNIDLTMIDLLEEIDLDIKNKKATYDEYKKSYRKDLANSVQNMIEKITLEFIENVYKIFPNESLCLAGGLFLNCVLNHKILEKTSFSNVHIVPASGDDGQSIGAAFYIYEKLKLGVIDNSKISAFLGLSYSNDEILFAISKFNFSYKILADNELIVEIAELIKHNFVGGVLRGRSEMGPRALGHRSIIANPSSYTMRDHINRYVKHREVFRPFAPMVKSDCEFDIFNLKASSPYMLFSTKVKTSYRKKLKAISHIDGSARVQSICESSDIFLYNLLIEIENKIGLPVLLNTSFNLPNEPIVESPQDALNVFSKSNLDFLVLENYLIIRDYCHKI
jgi:carbamoyltransferase